MKTTITRQGGQRVTMEVDDDLIARGLVTLERTAKISGDVSVSPPPCDPCGSGKKRTLAEWREVFRH